MSWGTCYSGSNNIHFDFPPLMDDTRLFSNYYSSVLNDSVFQNNKNIKNNSDYRKYLQVYKIINIFLVLSVGQLQIINRNL